MAYTVVQLAMFTTLPVARAWVIALAIVYWVVVAAGGSSDAAGSGRVSVSRFLLGDVSTDSATTPAPVLPSVPGTLPPPQWRPTMACEKDCLVWLGYLIAPGLSSRRLLLRQLHAPYMPQGMDMGFVTSMQLATSLWTAIQIENSTHGDIFAVDSYYEGVGDDSDVPVKTRAWIRLAAQMGNRYKYYARLDSDSLVQPIMTYQRLLRAPNKLYMYCRMGAWDFCSGTMIAVSNDLVQSIVETVPDMEPEHEDKSFTKWVRQATNHNIHICYSINGDLYSITWGTADLGDPQNWKHNIGMRTMVVHGPKKLSDYLMIWEMLYPHLEDWRTCAESSFSQPECAPLAGVRDAESCGPAQNPWP